MTNPPQITITSERLSDGSEAHNVVIFDGYSEIELPAVTYKDALALSDKLAEAFDRHTTMQFRQHVAV